MVYGLVLLYFLRNAQDYCVIGFMENYVFCPKAQNKQMKFGTFQKYSLHPPQLLYVVALLLMASTASYGQKRIEFDTTFHDFGDIPELGPRARCKFYFRNTGTEPIRLKNVKASCGCTTPKWSEEVVFPGDSGYVLTEYDQKGRPGSFLKSISVISDAEPAITQLFIKGNVLQDSAAPEETKVIPHKIPKDFEYHFAYNAAEVSDQDRAFANFINTLIPYLRDEHAHGKVTISILASASKVPTDKFETNEALAAFRARETREKLQRILQQRNVSVSTIKFDIQTKVQGPEYNNDFEENRDQYERFQFVRIQVRG
jgi:hypothetical protein